MSMRRLAVSEVRAHPGRLAGAAVACAMTAAGLGACVLLYLGTTGLDLPENSVAADETRDAQDLLSLLLSLLLMCAVVVIGSTVSLWTSQRLGQFAVLRALGVTSGRLRLLVAGDVAGLAFLSAAAGTAVGMVPLARLGHGLLEDRRLYPSTGLPSAGATWAVAAGVCAATAAVAVLAALASVLAAGRVSPGTLMKDAEATSAASRSTARWVTGLAMALLLCAPLLYVMAFMDLPATVRAAVAPGLALMLIPTLAVLAPWIVPLLLLPVCTVLRVTDRQVGRVAAAGLRAAPARTTAMAVPVLLAVGIAVCLLGAGATMGTAVQRETEDGLRADGVVTAAPGTRLPADPATAFPGGTATALVAAEVTAPPTDLDSSPKAVKAWGVDGSSLVGVIDLDGREGALSAVREGTFAAGSAVAEAQKWHIGDHVGLTLTDGSRTTLTLVAVYERDIAFPEFIVSRSTALDHADAPYADRILLTGSYRSWSAPRGQTVLSRDQYLHNLQPRSAADDFASRLIVAVVCGYALLAAANTSSLAQRDRRTQQAHLRALGLGKGQLLRCLLYESLGTAVVGVTLAAVTALACLVPLAVVLGVGVLPTLDVPWTVGVLLGSVLALAIPSTVTARPLASVQQQFARRTG